MQRRAASVSVISQRTHREKRIN